MQKGLVISYFGNSVAVEAEDGQVFQCHLRRNQELPVVGDHVQFEMDQGETGTISAIVERRTVLGRSDNRGKMKTLAANVDAMLIVMSPPPVFADYLVDRYMVAGELLGVEPVLVLNKSDLLAETSDLSFLESYRQIPYPVILSSTIAPGGLNDLAAYLQQKSAVLVGPSGVGKSSIIMGLVDEAIRTTAVSPKGAGKHTTTATRLYHLPKGGSLIDSPGVREFNLWPINEKEVLRGFKEFQRYLQGCKFRDCSHLAEPGCIVQEAIAKGEISAARFQSYKSLMQQARSIKKYT